jgi:glutamate-1-semialdehyde aminotransferase
VLDGNRGCVAAVILEPTANVLPRAGFLEGVKRLTHAHGAALIFDEMVTGFRVARGGAQEAWGVVPDMACFGKALANGMPLSALVGRAEVMNALPGVGFGLTYRGELLSLAAARAALELHAREPVARHVESLGEAVRAGFAARARDHGLAMQLEGFAGRMTVRAQPANGISELGVRTVFLQECLRAGVLTNGTFMGSWAHDATAVERTFEAFDAALAVTERAVSAGLVEPFLDVAVTPAFYEA